MVKPMWNWNVTHAARQHAAARQARLEALPRLRPKRATCEPMRFRCWRYFWDYSGGNMTDQGTHLMDVVQWITKSGAPRSAVCYGQRREEDRRRSAGRVLRRLRVSRASWPPGR